MKRGMLALVVVLLAGCPADVTPGPDGSNADVPLLFMGNSHTSINDVPGTVEALVLPTHPGETVEAIEAPGWMFLEERLSDAPSLALLRGQDWSFVVLQAQKYSSSGCCVYSTAEAEEFIRIARRQNAVPILFPEWPRRGIDETGRIYGLHASIARVEPACVAPIPQAFDLALERHPGLVLHASDGNHSSPNGAFLAALVLATTMTGASPLDAPELAGIGVTAEDQALLRAVAADTVAAWPPRQLCPNDPYPTPPAPG